ncbi:MAG: hypothetical protein AB4352_23085 [Hormoscilla sp.]
MQKKLTEADTETYYNTVEIKYKIPSESRWEQALGAGAVSRTRHGLPKDWECSCSWGDWMVVLSL